MRTKQTTVAGAAYTGQGRLRPGGCSRESPGWAPVCREEDPHAELCACGILQAHAGSVHACQAAAPSRRPLLSGLYTLYSSQTLCMGERPASLVLSHRCFASWDHHHQARDGPEQAQHEACGLAPQAWREAGIGDMPLDEEPEPDSELALPSRHSMRRVACQFRHGARPAAGTCRWMRSLRRTQSWATGWGRPPRARLT